MPPTWAAPIALIVFAAVLFFYMKARIGRAKRRAGRTHAQGAPVAMSQGGTGSAPPPGGRLAKIRPNRQIVRDRSGNLDFLADDRARRARHAAAPDRRPLWGLPVIETPDALWQFLGLRDFRELVQLADPNLIEGRPAYRTAMKNYHVRSIPKRSGGEPRILQIPKPRLMAVQRRLLREILEKIPNHPAATAFHRGADIATHAAPHCGRPVVLCSDLRDFFGTVTQRRVAALFQWLGYPSSVAHILSLLCTTYSRYDRTRPSRRCLPQGAPSSPALANLVCHALDRRLSGLARRFEADYTRYADDLTFSGGDKFKRGMKNFLALLDAILRDEGFYPQRKKRRIMRRGRPQRVTGLLVNDRPSLGRAELDRLRAILHNAARAGSLESQNRERRPNFRAYLEGRIAWAARFHPARAARLRASLDALPAE